MTKRNTTIRALSALYSMVGSRERTGALVGLSGQTVIRLLRDAGVAIKKPGRPNEQLAPHNLVIAYWERGESLRDIGRRAGVSHGKVRSEMIKYGIPTR